MRRENGLFFFFKPSVVVVVKHRNAKRQLSPPLPRKKKKTNKHQHVRALVSKPGPEDAHAFPVSLLDVAAASPTAAQALLRWPAEGLDALCDALLSAQEDAVGELLAEKGQNGNEEDDEGDLYAGSSLSVKARAAVRLLPLPAPLLPLLASSNRTLSSSASSASSSTSSSSPFSTSFPLSRLRTRHAGALVSVTGTIVRAGAVVALERERSFECARCGWRARCRADLSTRSAPVPPPACDGCKENDARSDGDGGGGGGGRNAFGGRSLFSTNNTKRPPAGPSWIPLDDAEPPSHADFQEALLAEGSAVTGGGGGGNGGGGSGGGAGGDAAAAAASRSPLPLLLLDDLAGKASAGDSATLVGVLVRRWKGVAPSVSNAAPVSNPNSSSSSSSSLPSFAFSAAQPREGARCDVELALVVHGAVGGRFGDGGAGVSFSFPSSTSSSSLATNAPLLPAPPRPLYCSDPTPGSSNGNGNNNHHFRFPDKFSEFWHLAASSGSTLAARDAIVAGGVAPHLAGMFAPKLAVALQLAAPPPARGRAAAAAAAADNNGGKGNGTFSSSSSSAAARRSVHVLLRGEPGTGKSALLAAAVACRGKRGVLVFGGGGGGGGGGSRGGGGGGGTSAAGLTASAARDPSTGEWALEPGALVLADGGLCALDGLDSLPADQRGALHEAMEQQSVSVAKAGLVATLPTRACVLASAVAPPKNSSSKRNNGGRGGGKHGGGGVLEAPLLSRFDLVFVLRDPRTREFDESVCDAVLGEEEEEEEEESDDERGRRRRRRRPASSLPSSTSTSSSSSFLRPWTPELLREYAQWLRSRPSPDLTKEAERVLLAAYRARRRRAAASANGGGVGENDFGAFGFGGGGGNSSNDNSGLSSSSGNATIRHLESLARIAVAHARLVGRTEAGMQDAVVAVALADAADGGGGGGGSRGGGGGNDFSSDGFSSQFTSSSASSQRSNHDEPFHEDSGAGAGIGRGVAGVPAFDAVRSRPCGGDPDRIAYPRAAAAVAAMVEREEALARRAAAAAAAAAVAAGNRASSSSYQYGDYEDEEAEEDEEDDGRGGGGGRGSYF